LFSPLRCNRPTIKKKKEIADNAGHEFDGRWFPKVSQVRRKGKRPIRIAGPTLQSSPTKAEQMEQNKKKHQDIPMAVFSPRRRGRDREKSKMNRPKSLRCGDPACFQRPTSHSRTLFTGLLFPVQKTWETSATSLPSSRAETSPSVSLVKSDLLTFPSLLLRSSLSRCSHQRGQGGEVNA
jgi:hypothetical protein